MNPTYNIIKEISASKSYGLYIHVPFCHGRCAYCDFYSQTSCDGATKKIFVDAVKFSINSLSKANVPVSTLYFGGGTPSVLGPDLAELVTFIKQQLDIMQGAEITVEVNPESLDATLLEGLQKSGVNRISIGIQSLEDRVLSLLSRRHTKKVALNALRLLNDSGINYSADLIAAIPSTTPDDMKSWIDQVVAYNPSHLSIYPLTVEPRSGLASHPLFENIDEDFSADCLEQAWDDVLRHGYRHYEISNFALSGCESRHNTSYWESDSYIGIGPSASTAVNGADNSRSRLVLRQTLSEFCSKPSVDLIRQQEDFEVLTPLEALREDIMLSMRLSTGADLMEINKAGLNQIFSSLADEGLVLFDISTNHFIPTKRGWMLGNEMFGAIWCAER